MAHERTTAEHFVVVAGLPKENDSEMVLVTATSVRQAHEFVAKDYRRKRDLAPNVYVRTATLHRSDDEAEAALYMARLMAQMAAANNGAASTAESGSNGSDQKDGPS